ncbi:hypothetical protein MP638_000351 [Amoeboaphelidium occidentale]|nr:hypothetical protein MP638_000351 [Amoeboaphelidium occidentale]
MCDFFNYMMMTDAGVIRPEAIVTDEAQSFKEKFMKMRERMWDLNKRRNVLVAELDEVNKELEDMRHELDLILDIIILVGNAPTEGFNDAQEDAPVESLKTKSNQLTKKPSTSSTTASVKAKKSATTSKKRHDSNSSPPKTDEPSKKRIRTSANTSPTNTQETAPTPSLPDQMH